MNSTEVSSLAAHYTKGCLSNFGLIPRQVIKVVECENIEYGLKDESLGNLG
jgi:hypothetical protein